MIDAISRKRATMNVFNMAIEIIRKRLGSHYKEIKLKDKKKSGQTTIGQDNTSLVSGHQWCTKNY